MGAGGGAGEGGVVSWWRADGCGVVGSSGMQAPALSAAAPTTTCHVQKPEPPTRGYLAAVRDLD